MTPRDEGRAAYLRGYHLSNNPHAPGDFHRQWESGWVIAERLDAWTPPPYRDLAHAELVR